MALPDISYRTSPPMTVVYAERRGSYSGIGEAMAELSGWLKSVGAEPAGDPFCLFYDNPGETPERELRSEACIPVKARVSPAGKFRSKDIPQTQVAETKHSGPPEEFGRTYGPFLEGLLKQGFSLDGPAREYFRKVSDVKGPGSGYLIQQPISKKIAYL